MLFSAKGAERVIFAGREIWELGVCPDLTMRVRVAGAHQFATILEDLHVTDPGDLCEFRVLFGPRVDHGAQFAGAHTGNGEIVPWRKTQDTAETAVGLRHKQTVLPELQRRRIR